MNNILYQSLPTEWKGYRVNTGFHIGVQISLLLDDETLNERAKAMVLSQLLFGNDDGTLREIPETMEELSECIQWFMGGWSHDNSSDSEQENIKLMDYDIDQGRIYADFMRLYGIDLELTEMHWWKFNWLLWNMPAEQSSFLQVIGFRQEKPRKGASAEEKQAIVKRHAMYDLEQRKPKYDRETISAIDEYDQMMARIKNK